MLFCIDNSYHLAYTVNKETDNCFQKGVIFMNVFNLKPGNKGLIKELACDDKLAKRLLALGFVEGTEILVKKVAPLGDPIIVNLRGTDLAIRKKDAQLIYIKEAV